jgi:hypothetical protein
LVEELEIPGYSNCSSLINMATIRSRNARQPFEIHHDEMEKPMDEEHEEMEDSRVEDGEEVENDQNPLTKVRGLWTLPCRKIWISFRSPSKISRTGFD